jgi:hypothetical protein
MSTVVSLWCGATCWTAVVIARLRTTALDLIIRAASAAEFATHRAPSGARVAIPWRTDAILEHPVLRNPTEVRATESSCQRART